MNASNLRHTQPCHKSALIPSFQDQFEQAEVAGTRIVDFPLSHERRFIAMIKTRE
jgi:hypothetical protein